MTIIFTIIIVGGLCDAIIAYPEKLLTDIVSLMFAIGMLVIKIWQCISWKKYYFLIYLSIIAEHLLYIKGLHGIFKAVPIIICLLELYYFYKRKETFMI